MDAALFLGTRSRTSVLLVVLAVSLAGCGWKLFRRPTLAKAPTQVECADGDTVCLGVQHAGPDTIRPMPRKATPTGEGFVQGQEPEELDKTTDAEKVSAHDTTDAGTRLGTTIASLGDVAEQGFWLKTPLVIEEQAGRVVWADNGNSVNVTLFPKQGEKTSGSQVSLAAMRALGIPLTTLPELIVFAN